MQRKAIVIRNLTQLKKAITSGHCFEIVDHYLHPDFSGQVRQPTKVQTNGFYSQVYQDDNHKVSHANGGLGYWMEYKKASDWEFNGEICTCWRNTRGFREKVWDIRVLDIQVKKGA